MRRECHIVFLLPLLCSCQYAAASQLAPSLGRLEQQGTGAPRPPGEHLHPYLQRKLQEIEGVVRQANLVYGDYESQEDTLDIRVVNVNKDELTRYLNASAATLHAFGSLYVLVDDNVLVLHEHAGHIIVEFKAILPDIEGFLTAQSTLLSDITLILFLFEDHLELYSSPSDGSWSSLAHAQSITNDRLKPISAEFVHCLERLYLAVAYADPFGGTVNSLIYEWTGSHMDEIYELPSAGAVDLTVILQQNYFYVAIAERPPSDSKHCVTIYKITPGADLRRHRILVKAPSRLLNYDDFHGRGPEETFLLILDAAGKGTVLKLEGDEFIQHHTLKIGSPPKIATVGYLEALPVLIMAYEDHIFVSKLSKTGLISELSLPVDGTVVTMLELVEVEYGIYRIVVASKTKSNLMINIINLAVRRNIMIQPPRMDPLEVCVQQLTEETNSRQMILDQLNLNMHQLDTSEDVTFDGELSLEHEVKISSSKLGQVIVDTGTPLRIGEDELMETGRQVLEKIETLEEKLKELVYKDRPIVIDYPVVLEGDLTVNKLEAEFIIAGKVNGDDFSSDHFVWESKDINIEAENENVIEELHVVNLTAPTIFLEGFLTNPTARNLKVNNILIPEDQTVNGIYLDQIVLKNHEYIIEGKKIIENVVADTVYVENVGEVNMEEVFSKPPRIDRITTSGDVIIEDLIVETVNGVNMTEFMENVFIRGVDDTIEGDIIFNKELEINELETNIFQGIPVEEMLTKTTDQVITANVTFDTLSFEEGQFGLINGLNISKDVALLGKHNVIKSPVHIDKLNIQGNLILNCGKHQHHFCNLLDVTPEDMIQIYEAPVYIDGSLTAHNVEFSEGATVVVGGEYFHTDFEQLFWLKSKKQRIPDGITFTAGLTVPHIKAAAMNGEPLQNFATVHTDFSDTPVYFNELHLDGDLSVQPGTECVSVAELGRDVVTSNGDFVITGKKIFGGTVETKHLTVSTIDGVDVNDIVLLDDPREKTFLGDVSVRNVEVKGDLRAYCDIEASLVNEYPLKRVAERALRVDRDAYLESVTFRRSLQGTNILVENGPLVDGLSNMDRLFEGINVTVDGELKLTNGVNQVKYLNGIDFESYIGQVVDKDIGGFVAGKKVFNKGLQVTKALEAKTINGIDFENIIKKAVRKQGVQTITGTHEIEHLYTDRLTTKYLNDLDTDNLVDASQPIVINSSLIFENVNIFGSLTANTPLDLRNFKESLTKFKSRCWDEVNIDGGIDWTIPGAVSEIVEYAVHGYHDNIITGNVKFLAPVETNNLITEVYIDDVDIQFIANDAVLRSAPDQEIFGKKIFVGPTEIKHLYVAQEFYSRNISGFDLSYINKTMARKYEENYFQGHVTFSGNVSTNYIKANSIIGIPDLKDILTVDTTQSINNVDASRVHVTGDLRLNEINGLNFTNFIHSIVLTEGETQYVYGDVEFEALQIGELRTDKINNVNVDNIVFDDPETVNIIKGDITFKGDVIIDADVEVRTLNNINVNEAYEKTWWFDEDTIIPGNLELKGKSVFAGGLYGMLNGIDVKKEVFKAISQMDANIDSSIVALRETEEILIKTRRAYEEMVPEFLYLEAVKRMELKVARSARSTASCRADGCTLIVHNTNLDCPRAGSCACLSQRLIVMDTSNWVVSSMDETLNRKSFIVTGHEGIEVATIEAFISENNDYGCRVQQILMWSSSDYLDNDNNNFIDITYEIKGNVVDVKSAAVGDKIIIAIIVNNEFDRNEESIIMALDLQERTIIFRGSVATCGARQVATAVAGGCVHVLFANADDRCDRVAGLVYKYDVERQQISSIESDMTLAYRVTSTTTNENEVITFVAGIAEGQTELKELVYDIKNNVYATRQRFEVESHPVVGLELINIYGPRNYDTVLCVASSDGSVEVYIKQHVKGWQLKSSGRVEGATGLLPLSGSVWPFVLVTSSNSSAVLSLTCNGLS